MQRHILCCGFVTLLHPLPTCFISEYVDVTDYNFENFWNAVEF